MKSLFRRDTSLKRRWLHVGISMALLIVMSVVAQQAGYLDDPATRTTAMALLFGSWFALHLALWFLITQWPVRK